MRRLVVAIAILFSASAASAADANQRENRLLIRHYAGLVELRDGANNVVDQKALQTDISYNLRQADTIVAVVSEANPLLFTYAWKDEPPTETGDFAAAKKFADALKSITDLLKKFGPEEKQFGQDFTLFTDYCAEADVHDVRFCKAGFDPQFVGTFENNVTRLHAQAGRVPELVRQSALSWTAALAVRDTVANDFTDTADLIKAVRAEYAKLHDINRKVALGRMRDPIQIAVLGSDGDTEWLDTALQQAGGSHGTGGTLPNTQPPVLTPEQIKQQQKQSIITAEPLAHAFRVLLDDEKSVENDITALENFVSRASKIGEPIQLKTVKYNVSQIQPAVLTIAKIPIDVQPLDVSRYKTGDFKLAFSPGGPVHYDYGVSAIYSFLEVPTFDAKKGDDDKLHIVRTDNGDAVSGTTGALTLTIVPQRWEDPQFSLGFQLGVSPVKDKIGIFLGPRIRVYNLFTFSAGITYQQTKRLSGQSLGDIVESADKIKTTNVFKPAAYVSIGLDLLKK